MNELMNMCKCFLSINENSVHKIWKGEKVYMSIRYITT